VPDHVDVTTSLGDITLVLPPGAVYRIDASARWAVRDPGADQPEIDPCTYRDRHLGQHHDHELARRWPNFNEENAVTESTVNRRWDTDERSPAWPMPAHSRPRPMTSLSWLAGRLGR